MSDRTVTNERSALAKLRDVSKFYRKGEQTIKALDGIDLTVAENGMVAIVGPSGSGKSSLLHVIGAMDRPTAGDVIVAGQSLGTLPERGLTDFRRKSVGFVFQSFNLIPNLDTLENVMLPMEFNGVARDARRRRAAELLSRIGLAERLNHKPRELSGGEQQRVAIARALANDPPLILADEPTGNLDSKTGQMIYELLVEIARDRTVMVVTHAEMLAAMADRVVHIRDGKLVAINYVTAKGEKLAKSIEKLETRRRTVTSQSIVRHATRPQPEAFMFTIGKVAARAQVSADSIRFYEREGLLSPARKSESGYRLYTEEAIRRLGFIKHAQQCGFSLAEIRDLLELKGHDRSCCNDVYRVAVEKKLQLEGKIKALKTMSQALSRLIDICSHDAKPLDECPILAALESSIAGENTRSKRSAKRRSELCP